MEPGTEPAAPVGRHDAHEPATLVALGVIVAAGAGVVALTATQPGNTWFTGGAVAIGALMLGLCVSWFVATGIVKPLRVALSREHRARIEAEAALRDATITEDVLRRFDRALAMVDSEAAALGAMGRALSQLLPERDHQLLLASADDPDQVRWAVPLDREGTGVAEQLDAGLGCGALLDGNAVVLATSESLDRCPHLQQREPEVSASCVPLRVGDNHLGAICSTGAPGEILGNAHVAAVERLARATGARITAVRTASNPVGTELLCDPLTGLPNHTAMRAEMKSLIGTLTPFSLALCDLDDFAGYNAEHGTDQGDRALRLVARTLGGGLRPGDRCFRFEGDVFAVLFPRCSTLHAQSAMERFRESLVLGLAEAGQPHVAWSAGIADSSQGASIDELVESAEIALIVAKHEGGNRVRTAAFEADGFETGDFEPGTFDRESFERGILEEVIDAAADRPDLTVDPAERQRDDRD